MGNTYWAPKLISTKGFNSSKRQITAKPYIHCPTKKELSKIRLTLPLSSVTPRFPTLAVIPRNTWLTS